METVVIFTACEDTSPYEVLAVSNVHIEVVPFTAAAIGEHAMELAIIDCGNEVEAGLRLLKQIKQNRADVPVIFVTGVRSEALVVEAFRMGARDYFRKPLDLKELDETITRILGFKRVQPGKQQDLAKRRDAGFPAPFQLPDELPERLVRAISYIDENLTDPLSLDAIARQACLSKYHFCRLFKRNVGVSPIRYSMYRRIEHACEILCKPNQSITLTAFQSGFNDVTEFIRRFREITGVTPGAYRKSRCKSLPSH